MYVKPASQYGNILRMKIKKLSLRRPGPEYENFHHFFSQKCVACLTLHHFKLVVGPLADWYVPRRSHTHTGKKNWKGGFFLKFKSAQQDAQGCPPDSGKQHCQSYCVSCFFFFFLNKKLQVASIVALSIVWCTAKSVIIHVT